MTTTPACPTWCTVDHSTDGYSDHGHTVHRAFNRTDDGHRIDFWQSTAVAGVSRVEPAQIHVGELAQQFTDSDELRRYAVDLLNAADDLDAMNAEVHA